MAAQTDMMMMMMMPLESFQQEAVLPDTKVPGGTANTCDALPQSGSEYNNIVQHKIRII